MLKIVLLSAALSVAAGTSAHAQSAIETAYFLLNGETVASSDSYSGTSAYNCGDASKSGCYVSSTFTQINNCEYVKTSTLLDHNKNGFFYGWNGRIQLDFSKASSIESHEENGRKGYRIVGGPDLFCFNDEKDRKCDNHFQHLGTKEDPVDFSRSVAAFAYFRDNFCKGRAF